MLEKICICSTALCWSCTHWCNFHVYCHVTYRNTYLHPCKKTTCIHGDINIPLNIIRQLWACFLFIVCSVFDQIWQLKQNTEIRKYSKYVSRNTNLNEVILNFASANDNKFFFYILVVNNIKNLIWKDSSRLKNLMWKFSKIPGYFEINFIWFLKVVGWWRIIINCNFY